MDTRYRDRHRNWQASNDPADKAAAMREAIRYGKLDPRMVQLAAFLGDESSRLVGDDVKPLGVIIKGKLLKNEEMSDLAEGLTNFGIEAVRYVNLGLFRMSINQWSRRYPYYQRHRCAARGTWIGLNYWEYYREEGWSNINNAGISVEDMFVALEQAVKVNVKDKLDGLSRYDVDRWQRSYSMPRYLPEVIGNICYESVTNSRPRPKLVKFCNGFYSDEVMLKYIAAEVLPFALGEFYTGPEVEPLNAVTPLSPRSIPPRTK